MKPNAAEIPEGGEKIEDEAAVGLNKSFGLSKKFSSKFEIGEVVGRGHFGYTCSAIAKKGDLKAHKLAVKIIPKSKVSPIIKHNLVDKTFLFHKKVMIQVTLGLNGIH